MLSHMGEANVAMARKDRKIAMTFRQESLVPMKGRQLTLAVSYQPGDATLTALTLVDGNHWRIIASPVTILDFGPLDHLPVPHAKVSPAGDVRDFLTAYATAGGPHHMGICFGDARARLEIVAGMIDADYVEV